MKYCLILLIFINLSFGYKKCLRPPAVPISEEFLTGGEFVITSHSYCDNCEEDDDGTFQFPLPKQGNVGSYCWKVQGKKGKNDFECDMECTFNSRSEQVCLKVSSRGNAPPMKGSVIITKTDNSTYFGAAICRFGRENFWFVAIPAHTQLPEDTKNEVLEHFRLEGFNFEEDHKDWKFDIIFSGFRIFKKSC